MAIPPQYAPWLASLGFQEISYDVGGLRLFTPEELEEAQVGYSRSADGQSFCNGDRESWKPQWLVIGHETALGDPIFIDTSASGLPVLTAMHGEGAWEPRMIALSLEDFAVALSAPQERDRALRQIAGAKQDEIDMDFWEAMLG